MKGILITAVSALIASVIIIGLLMIVRTILDKVYDILDKKKNKSDSPKNQDMIKRQAAIRSQALALYSKIDNTTEEDATVSKDDSENS